MIKSKGKSLIKVRLNTIKKANRNDKYSLSWHIDGKRYRKSVGIDYTFANKMRDMFESWIDEGLNPYDEYEYYMINKDDTNVNEKVFTTPKVSFLNKKIGTVDWREYIRQCSSHQDLVKNSSYTQDFVKIKIDTNKPIAISWSADWHLASLATDYESWQNDIEYILQTPNLYMATVGDLIENFPMRFKSAKAPASQLFSPEQQQNMLEGILTELVQNEKILMAAKGNHDVDFDENNLGHSQVKKFMSRLVPFFSGKGFAQITVGNEMYTVLMVHKTRFSSYMHNLHGIKQEYKETIPADIVVGAHTHTPGFECYHHYDMAREYGYNFGGESYLIKTGTYKVDDEYSKTYWGKGVVGAPTTILFPNTHKIVTLSNAEDAVALMQTYD